ncbi:MAG: hypothetical protein K0Q67_2838, partial [Cellvibrio sp.]|nr:hypothetical protein [Cellvibrio sp.]
VCLLMPINSPARAWVGVYLIEILPGFRTVPAVVFHEADQVGYY